MTFKLHLKSTRKAAVTELIRKALGLHGSSILRHMIRMDQMIYIVRIEITIGAFCHRSLVLGTNFIDILEMIIGNIYFNQYVKQRIIKIID